MLQWEDIPKSKSQNENYKIVCITYNLLPTMLLSIQFSSIMCLHVQWQTSWLPKVINFSSYKSSKFQCHTFIAAANVSSIDFNWYYNHFISCWLYHFVWLMTHYSTWNSSYFHIHRSSFYEPTTHLVLTGMLKSIWLKRLVASVCNKEFLHILAIWIRGIS